jgi:hypothetical protein
MSITYPKILAMFYPNVEYYTQGPAYSDIVWLSDAISKDDLDAKALDTVKSLRISVIKEESIVQRAFATKGIVGTNDILMLRTYDSKREEATRLLATYPNTSDVIDDSTFFLLRVESTNTGTPLRVLAEAVLEQYALSAQYLNPILGAIEAVRRNKIAEIIECTTITDVDNLVNPIWPDLSFLSAI